MAGHINSKTKAVTAQMHAMGWRLMPVSLTPGAAPSPKWLKYYPPPHEVPEVRGKLAVIGVFGDGVWRRDMARAAVLAAEDGYSIPKE